MNQQNQGPSSSSQADLPIKRKRGRPRKDDSLTQQEKTPVTPRPDSTSNTAAAADNLVGQVVSGVIEGTFDAGYFLNVKVGGTDTHLRGVVFLPGRVAPITVANDVAPYARMYKREELHVPCFNQQNQPQGSVSSAPPAVTNDKLLGDVNSQSSKLADQTQGSELQFSTPIIDKNQSALGMISLPNNMQNKETGTSSELLSRVLITDKNESASIITPLCNDLRMTEAGTSSGEIIPSKQILDSAPQSVALITQQEQRDLPNEGQTVQVLEASDALKVPVTDTFVAHKNESEPAATPFVDFLPCPETANREQQAQQQAMNSSFKPNYEVVLNEIKMADTNQSNNSPFFGKHLGINIMMEKQASPLENLQLELGNRTTNADGMSHLRGLPKKDIVNNIGEVSSPSAVKSGFLANLFEGGTEPKPAANETVLPRVVESKVESSSVAANNLDCNIEDGIPPAQSQNPMVLN